MRIYKKFSLLILVITILSCSKDGDIKNSEAKLLSFSIKELSESFTINPDNNVSTKVDSDKDLNNLTGVFTISKGAILTVGTKVQSSGYSKNDFNNNVVYTVKGEDGTQSNYTISINKDGKILNYQIVELPNTPFKIDNLNISADVPYGTTLSNLIAKFTLTDKSQLYVGSTLQVSEKTINNFTQPLEYTLKDGSGETKTYKVTIYEKENIAPLAKAGADQNHSLFSPEASKKILLDASDSSDEDGEILNYKWHEGSTLLGEGVKLEVDLTLGKHTITLTVKDNFGLTHSDDLIVNIQRMSVYIPADANATQETKNLFNNLAKIAHSDQFIFGQEFPMSFKLNGTRNDLSTSDSKEVAGDHPGVFGIDPHYMLYKSAADRELHINEAKYAFNNGAVVTLDFLRQQITPNNYIKISLNLRLITLKIKQTSYFLVGLLTENLQLIITREIIMWTL